MIALSSRHISRDKVRFSDCPAERISRSNSSMRETLSLIRGRGTALLDANLVMQPFGRHYSERPKRQTSNGSVVIQGGAVRRHVLLILRLRSASPAPRKHRIAHWRRQRAFPARRVVTNESGEHDLRCHYGLKALPAGDPPNSIKPAQSVSQETFTFFATSCPAVDNAVRKFTASPSNNFRLTVVALADKYLAAR